MAEAEALRPWCVAERPLLEQAARLFYTMPRYQAPEIRMWFCAGRFYFAHADAWQLVCRFDDIYANTPAEVHFGGDFSLLCQHMLLLKLRNG